MPTIWPPALRHAFDPAVGGRSYRDLVDVPLSNSEFAQRDVLEMTQGFSATAFHLKVLSRRVHLIEPPIWLKTLSP